MKRFAPDIEAFLEGRDEDMAMGGAYEGAGRHAAELALWTPSLRSADSEMGESKYASDARARDMLRNDAFVAGGAAVHRDSIVGSTFLLNLQPELNVLTRADKRLDETWSEEFQEEVETKFNLAAESPEFWLDAGRSMTLTDLIRLDVTTHLYGGESLGTVEFIREQARPFRTAILPIEVDRLGTPPEQEGKKDVVGGIRFNRYGAPQSYFIRAAHPSDWFDPDSIRYVEVPARKPWGRLQVLHLREQFRPDQTRGVSETIAAMKEMRTTKKFREVLLQNAVVNASYAASIESELPAEQALAAIGAGSHAPTGIGGAIVDFATLWLQAVSEFAGGAKNLHIDGVKIPHLFPGTKLQLRPMGTPGGVGTDFEAALLRYTAAGLGLSYEELSRDFSKSNYSSIRAAQSQTYRYMQSKKKAIADRKASMIFRLWFEEVLNAGDITSMPRNAPNFYEGQNADAYCNCSWIGAGRGEIDALKETQAAVLKLKNNLTTLEIEHARLHGADWRKVVKQIGREKRLQEDEDVLPVDDQQNSVNAASGAPREKDATGGGGDDDDV